MKILYQNYQPVTDKLSRSFSSHTHCYRNRDVGLPTRSAKTLKMPFPGTGIHYQIEEDE